MSTVTNPSTEDQLNEIFNELMNNKEIKELLQTMKEIKKGNIESNKENINNFAKKMREMSEMVPGSEELMKNIEVISVLHEKIFSYASRFRLYSLEFCNLYSILAEIRDNGDKPLSELEQMFVKSTQIRLAESIETLKLSWIFFVWVTYNYGSEEDKKLIKTIKLEEKSETNIATKKVEYLDGEMFGGMDPPPSDFAVFNMANNTGIYEATEEIFKAAQVYSQLKGNNLTGHISLLQTIVDDPNSTMQQKKEAFAGLVVATQTVGRKANPSRWMGMMVMKHGYQVVSDTLDYAGILQAREFMNEEDKKIMELNLEGMKEEQMSNAINEFYVMLAGMLDLDKYNNQAKITSDLFSQICIANMNDVHMTSIRKHASEFFEKHKIGKSEEQNKMNKLVADYEIIIKKYKMLIDNSFAADKVKGTLTDEHYLGLNPAVQDWTSPFKPLSHSDKEIIKKTIDQVNNKIDGMLTFIEEEQTNATDTDYSDKLYEIKMRIEMLQTRNKKFAIPEESSWGYTTRLGTVEQKIYENLGTLFRQADENMKDVNSYLLQLKTKHESTAVVPKGLDLFQSGSPQQMLPSGSSDSEPLKDAKHRGVSNIQRTTENFRAEVCKGVPHRELSLEMENNATKATFILRSRWVGADMTVSGIPEQHVRKAQLEKESRGIMYELDALLERIKKIQAMNKGSNDGLREREVEEVLDIAGIMPTDDGDKDLTLAQNEIEKYKSKMEDLLLAHDYISNEELVQITPLTLFAASLSKKEEGGKLQNQIIKVEGKNADAVTDATVRKQTLTEFLQENNIGIKDKKAELNNLMKQNVVDHHANITRAEINNQWQGAVFGAITVVSTNMLDLHTQILNGVGKMAGEAPEMVWFILYTLRNIIFMFFIWACLVVLAGGQLGWYWGFPIITFPGVQGDNERQNTQAKKTEKQETPASPSPPAETPVVPVAAEDTRRVTRAEQKTLRIEILKKVTSGTLQADKTKYNTYINIFNLAILYLNSKDEGKRKIQPEVKQITVTEFKKLLELKAYNQHLELLDVSSEYRKIDDAIVEIDRRIIEIFDESAEESGKSLYQYIVDDKVNTAGMKLIKAPGRTGGKITKRKRQLKNKTRRKKRVTKNLKKRKGLKKTGKKK